jgi:hypothetical protein
MRKEDKTQEVVVQTPRDSHLPICVPFTPDKGNNIAVFALARAGFRKN